MSVDDWARRGAERQYPALVCGEDERYDDFEARLNERDATADAFSGGIAHAFDALLSDEAVEAGAQLFAGPFKPNDDERDWARRIVQAAIDAVTKEARND